MLLFEATKIQIAKNVAKENQATKRHPLESLQCVLCTGYLRPKVKVREDHRVEARHHAPFLSQLC
jgi:hypothetical protein